MLEGATRPRRRAPVGVPPPGTPAAEAEESIAKDVAVAVSAIDDEAAKEAAKLEEEMAKAAAEAQAAAEASAAQAAAEKPTEFTAMRAAQLLLIEPEGLEQLRKEQASCNAEA